MTDNRLIENAYIPETITLKDSLLLRVKMSKMDIKYYKSSEKGQIEKPC